MEENALNILRCYESTELTPIDIDIDAVIDRFATTAARRLNFLV